MLSVLTAPSRLADQVSDNIALTAIKTSDILSKGVYNSVIIIPTYGQFIQLFCITYNSILNEKSKHELNEFMLTNFSKYYTKYEILKTLCMNETNGEQTNGEQTNGEQTNGEQTLGLIKSQLASEKFKTLLLAIGLNVDTLQGATIETLKQNINDKFSNVLTYITGKKSELENAFISIDINKIKELATSSSTTSKPVGGKSRKSKKRSNKTKKRKTKSRHRK